MEEEEQVNPPKQNGPMEIVAYNLLALAGYTILFKLVPGGNGVFIDGLAIIGHFVFCLANSRGTNRAYWLLSAFLVLVIGVSTCVAIGVSG